MRRNPVPMPRIAQLLPQSRSKPHSPGAGTTPLRISRGGPLGAPPKAVGRTLGWGRGSRSAHTALLLVLWAVLGPGLLTGCSSLNADKRILQQAVQKGFGRRYSGRAVDENYALVGDRVTYRDLFNADVGGTGSVDVDGTISVPAVGQVIVAGLTRREIETLLTQKLSAFYTDSSVQVTLEPGRGRVYYILGQVSSSGAKQFNEDLTILDAILRANPDEHSANLSRVRLIRADPVEPMIAILDVASIWQEGDSTDNWSLEEFDIIYVPPTVMQEIADFISGILVPFTSIFRSIFQLLFQFNRGSFGNRSLGVF